MRNPQWRAAMARSHARTVTAYDAGPVNTGLVVNAAKAAGEPVELLIYDFIGDDGWGGGVTPTAVVAALAEAGSSPVRVRINSPGGSVFDGLSIYNALKQHAAGVECVVDGIAASAASFIALAGARVTMPETSVMMIHNASTIEWGDKRAMAATAVTLGKIDTLLATIYSAKTGKPVVDMSAMMDAETYMPGAEALAAGFCDAVEAAPAAKPENSAAAVIVAEVASAALPPGVDPLLLARARARLRVADANP